MDDISPNIEDLARRCRQESKHFLNNQPYDEHYCLELFRQALLEHSQAAWHAIYAQYEKLVIGWVRQHPKFHSTAEEARFFANAAFTRFWRALSDPDKLIRLEHLSQLLRYLKSCVHSAIEDAYRRQQHRPQNIITWDDVPDTVPDDTASPTLLQLAEALEQLILDRLQGRAEIVVATSSWVYGLKPSEIQAQHPDLFPDVQQVYRVKRNVLHRLSRDPEIQEIRQQMRKK